MLETKDSIMQTTIQCDQFSMPLVKSENVCLNAECKNEQYFSDAWNYIMFYIRLQMFICKVYEQSANFHKHAQVY